MKDIFVKDIIEKCNGEMIFGNENEILEDFTNDTREVKPGYVYIGFKGEKTDGNMLYEKALENGAKVCILKKESVINNINLNKLEKQYNDRTIILVENTIKAIQQLASYKRSLYDIPVVGVTGSVGKTSTKDIIASVMSKKYNVLKTLGNYNSQIGLPLTVLRLKDHNAMVVEMGMSGLGEISEIAKIARPTVAVITNVGTAHIGELGSRENILKAKLEILDGLKTGGTLVINNDNDMLHKWNNTNKEKEYNVETFGFNNESKFMPYDVELKDNGSKYKINVDGKVYNVNVPVGGEHFILNSLCAISIGRLFNIKMEDILSGISNFELTKRRMQIEKSKNGVTIINDSYNANLDSMIAAIRYLGNVGSNKKIAVLGDMLELGKFSKELHEKVGEEVYNNKIDILITVGECAKDIAKKAQDCGMNNEKIHICNNNEQAIKLIGKLAKKDDTILLKASNGMNFEQIFKNII